MNNGNIAKIYHQFPLETLKKIIRELLEKRVALADRKRARLWNMYDQATKKGVPFADRQKLKPSAEDIAKLDELDANERFALKGFRVIPYEQWLEDGDYEMMRAIGFKAFLQVSLRHAYVATTTP